jgi:hypothetical protein
MKIWKVVILSVAIVLFSFNVEAQRTQYFDDVVITTADINDGTADSVDIGQTTPAPGAFTTLESTDPTTADHVGDRAYNDNRYEQALKYYPPIKQL